MGIIDTLKKKKPAGAKKKGAVDTHDHTHDHADAPKKVPVKLGKNAAHAAQHILVRPLVSEKSAVMESRGIYTFVVARTATKNSVRQAVHDLYGIRPIDVRIVNVQGKMSRAARTMGKRSDWKKAMVTLPKGNTIQVHEGV